MLFHVDRRETPDFYRLLPATRLSCSIAIFNHRTFIEQNVAPVAHKNTGSVPDFEGDETNFLRRHKLKSVFPPVGVVDERRTGQQLLFAALCRTTTPHPQPAGLVVTHISRAMR